ncbi:hypothetical protein L7F22_048745 [Adiantum nelumboides]|nr:hypothetical protein [Adiantum nelumboides]
MGVTCTSEDVVILQGEMGPLPDGIPSFTVQIINLCVAGCPVSDIHVSCGWFASTKLILPGIFKRVEFDDCIANDKLPLKWGTVLSLSTQTPFSTFTDLFFDFMLLVKEISLCFSLASLHMNVASGVLVMLLQRAVWFCSSESQSVIYPIVVRKSGIACN